MQPQKKEKYNVLVTGGAGFLGKAIIRELLDPDSPVKAATIRIFDQVVPLQYNTDFRLEYIRGDINDAEALKSACEGIDLVIHSAAIVDWGVKSDEEVLAVNVTGTENVVNACRHNSVRYLVFTSSQVNMARGGFYVRLGNIAHAHLSEFFAWLIRPVKFYHPKFSRFAVIYTCTEYTFNSEKAIKDFGFKPKYSPKEALERTIGYYKLRKEKYY